MFREVKNTRQVCLFRKDLEYLEDLGMRYGRKNLSGAVEMLITHAQSLEKKLERIQSAADQQKETYEKVRSQQIARTDPRIDPKEIPIQNIDELKQKFSDLKKARVE